MILPSLLLPAWLLAAAAASGAQENAERVARMPGLVAFWDFVRVEDGRWTSVHDPRAADRAYPVSLRRIGDPRSYRLDEWPYADAESRLVVEDEGPFGKAVRLDRGHVFGEISRADFDRGPLDLRGRMPFTFVAWVKFTGQRHLVAGVWDEGGWDRYGGRRQYALFGGLFGSRGVVAHVSTTGAASHPQSRLPGSQYARLKAIDGGRFADREWVCMAMTWDPARRELSAFQNGVRTPFAYADAVAQDVFARKDKEPINPLAFDGPIFSPRALVLKFNGYHVSQGGVAEHWIHVDTEGGLVTYGRQGTPDDGAAFRVTFDLQRAKRSLLPAPLDFAGAPGASAPLPADAEPRPGDEIVAGLWKRRGGDWERVGTELLKPLQEGAPFTFGRALGLGSEELKHGSQLLMGGVAVFNRPLTAEELRSIAFVARR
jgi:hypothetical protein